MPSADTHGATALKEKGEQKPGEVHLCFVQGCQRLTFILLKCCSSSKQSTVPLSRQGHLTASRQHFGCSTSKPTAASQPQWRQKHIPQKIELGFIPFFFFFSQAKGSAIYIKKSRVCLHGETKLHSNTHRHTSPSRAAGKHFSHLMWLAGQKQSSCSP